MVSLLYLPAHWFWMLALVNLTQAAMLAPLVPLSDALALSWSRSTTRNNSGAFEYGWVRGTGSAAFMAGLLVAGQAVGALGLASVIWFTAACLLIGRNACKDLRRRPGFCERQRGIILGGTERIVPLPYSCSRFCHHGRIGAYCIMVFRPRQGFE
jgi:MFS family permease